MRLWQQYWHRLIGYVVADMLIANDQLSPVEMLMANCTDELLCEKVVGFMHRRQHVFFRRCSEDSFALQSREHPVRHICQLDAAALVLPAVQLLEE